MATAFSTKYPNNIRTVSGSVAVYQDDVVLLCNTSGGAVTINLNEIPAGYWNTLYKLYVFDNSNNAGTNNITVVAPTGFKVNNAQTFVISTNGGGAIIRIGDNTNYLASLNSTGGGSIAVYDEGVLKTSAVSSFDFIGAGVNVTNSGNAVTVNVPNVVGGLIATVSLTGLSLPLAASNIRRVSEGTVFNNANGLPYSPLGINSEYGSFSGTFNTTTGIWTCPANGYYDITAFLALILNSSPNENSLGTSFVNANPTIQTSGLLVVGRTYVIKLIGIGDDFTNVGGTNVTGNTFVATGTTPTVWANSSQLYSPDIATISNTGTGTGTTGTISGTQTSGSLVVGNRYTIRAYVAGDDFTNVGGTNVTGNTFVATGTTPTNYTNGSTLDWIVPSTTVSTTDLSTGLLNFNEYIGNYGICVTDITGGTIYCQQQIPVYFNNSCLNISATYTGRYITASTQLHCRFLNKTQYGGALVTGSSFHFTIKRVY